MYVVVGNIKITTTTTTSVGYGLMRLSPRLLSESILRNPLPEASRIPLLSSGWRERSCNVAARIMRWGGSPARALTSSDATTPESRYAICGTGHAEGSLVRSGFILLFENVCIFQIANGE